MCVMVPDILSRRLEFHETAFRRKTARCTLYSRRVAIGIEETYASCELGSAPTLEPPRNANGSFATGQIDWVGPY